MRTSPDIIQLKQILLTKQWRLTTAESCTGGLLAAACTELPGSSVWLERGFVCYSNRSKTEMLGVPAALIEQHGAVSKAVAQAMALGALAHADAQVAIAITGIAGPDGGSLEKSVGTVWFSFAWPEQVVTEVQHFAGDRHQVRIASRDYALGRLLELLGHA